VQSLIVKLVGVLVSGLRNSVLHYTVSGMVDGFLAKSYGGLSCEGKLEDRKNKISQINVNYTINYTRR
jgi:hypothetical protein